MMGVDRRRRLCGCSSSLAYKEHGDRRAADSAHKRASCGVPGDSARKHCALRSSIACLARVCHECRRAAHLRKLDQTEMLGIRTAWFEEVGGPPIGNKRA